MSTFPLSIYRRSGGYDIETPIPPVFAFPGGPRVSWSQWVYMTQIDLDRTGNCFGLISQRDSLGLPARIDLVPATDVAVVMHGGELVGFRIKGTVFDPADVWHETQYRIAGLEVGLSPVAYASWSMGIYASLDNFIVEFLDNATTPSVVMKNVQRTLNDVQAKEMKDKWRATVQNGDALIIGADWEFSPFQAEQTGLNWLQAKQFEQEDIARFFNVPHDLLDISSSGSTGNSRMTYANIGQRNLQFLMFHLQPAIQRREEAWTNGLLPGPAAGQSQRANRYVKLDTDSLLRLDPTAQAALFASQIAAGILAPSEARERMNLPPLTDAQKAELQDVSQGGMMPPEPIANPNAKGLSQERKKAEFAPTDPTGGLPSVQVDDAGHCSACCTRAVQSSTDVQLAADCSCAAGCVCNPIGAGCLYASCPCDAPQEAAAPTYVPVEPKPGSGGVVPFSSTPSSIPREQEHKCPDNVFHIHVPERSVDVHPAEITILPAEVHFTGGDIHVDVPETRITIVDEQE